MIAYEVLTGEKPFSAEYLPTLLYKIVREEPLPPQRLNPTLGPQVETVLRKALAKNPATATRPAPISSTRSPRRCNATKGWMPLPRGASQNMPTVGSQEGLETIDDRGTPPAIAALTPPPLPLKPKQILITPDLPIEPIARECLPPRLVM